MATSRISPCLWLDHEAEAAADLYTRAFPGGRITAVARFPPTGDNPAHKPPGSVLSVSFEVAGRSFIAINGGPLYRPNPTVSFFVNLPDAAAVDALAAALLEGGKALMPVGAWPWSPRYGWVVDRFGVSWQIQVPREGVPTPTVEPCLMFNGAVHGRAEEALRRCMEIFAAPKVDILARYVAGEGPVDTLKHGRVELDGEGFVAMDSPVDHGVRFDEGLSLMVRCDDQSEVDRYWAALADGGKEGPCGWVTDRFGVSWQVVGAQHDRWLAGPDPAASDRAFQAILRMGKPDLAAIEAAFVGG